jgi:hypothetical protein
VTLDDDGAGRGWFVDPTPGDDAEFGVGVGPTERAGAAGGYDLLTVVTHELGHTLGLDSVDPAAAAHDLMTATLGVGTRRVPAAAAWSAGAAVNLWVDDAAAATPWAADAPAAAPVASTDTAWVAAPAAAFPASPAAFAPSGTDASGTWVGEDDLLLGGIAVG